MAPMTSQWLQRVPSTPTAEAARGRFSYLFNEVSFSIVIYLVIQNRGWSTGSDDVGLIPSTKAPLDTARRIGLPEGRG